ncbi:MAG: alpha/beta hydrolase [Euryarchaeota archaeon]|nr:alpha/beta hydrolase [Euryarchaeota archaeon]MDE1835111.1 alpha/beta hydrolase [Euryarchaeota archaeon]MDE1880703.1 alpha/beta hydrolase [Euryarchaeota archaeon]MDE2044926.1 alpha/beta hydrolase [Thermoplasmata archaeon]
MALPEAHERMVDLEGSPVHLWEGGEGPPLVFFHGAGSIGQGWVGAFPLLAQHHRVILPDLPGFGLSPDNPRLKNFRDLGAALIELLRSEGRGRVDLMGNSMGGGIAAGIALEHPELVRGLVLAAPGGLHENENMHAEAARVVPGEVNQWLFYRPERGRESFPTLSPEEVRTRWRSTRQALGRWVQQGFVKLDYPKLKVPTLIVWGRQDRILPSQWAIELSERIPGSRAVVLEECGHIPQLELPGEFTQIVEGFLSTLPSTNGQS